MLLEEKMKVSELIAWFENKAGSSIHPDEGLRFGDPNVDADKVQVSWMASANAIRAAGERGARLMVVHESVFFPYNATEKGGQSDFLSWRVNTRRVALLSEYGITVVRIHGTLDAVCVFDDFAAALGLPPPSHAEGLVKVYDPPPASVRDWVDRVKHSVGMDRLRVTAENLDRAVRRIGLPWGGLGLFVNVGYMQDLVKWGCDLFIAGETDDYGMRFALESGIPMIETSHEVSENFGLKHAEKMLAEGFPETEILFYENRIPWTIL